jgi:hypothetical protein
VAAAQTKGSGLTSAEVNFQLCLRLAIQIPSNPFVKTAINYEGLTAAGNLRIQAVESHRNHIMYEVTFKSFSDLVRFAIRNKLVEALAISEW